MPDNDKIVAFLARLVANSADRYKYLSQTSEQNQATFGLSAEEVAQIESNIGETCQDDELTHNHLIVYVATHNSGATFVVSVLHKADFSNKSLTVSHGYKDRQMTGKITRVEVAEKRDAKNGDAVKDKLILSIEAVQDG